MEADFLRVELGEEAILSHDGEIGIGLATAQKGNALNVAMATFDVEKSRRIDQGLDIQDATLELQPNCRQPLTASIFLDQAVPAGALKDLRDRVGAGLRAGHYVTDKITERLGALGAATFPTRASLLMVANLTRLAGKAWHTLFASLSLLQAETQLSSVERGSSSVIVVALALGAAPDQLAIADFGVDLKSWMVYQRKTRTIEHESRVYRGMTRCELPYLAVRLIVE